MRKSPSARQGSVVPTPGTQVLAGSGRGELGSGSGLDPTPGLRGAAFSLGPLGPSGRWAVGAGKEGLRHLATVCSWASDSVSPSFNFKKLVFPDFFDYTVNRSYIYMIIWRTCTHTYTCMIKKFHKIFSLMHSDILCTASFFKMLVNLDFVTSRIVTLHLEKHGL